MALINQNSIIGVTSITSPSASNVLTVHTNDTTERLRVSTSGVSFSGTNASLDTSGNLTIAGVLTYEDVTNVDSVGLSTFQNGIHVTGGDVGIGTNNPTFSNGSGLEVARDGTSCIRIEGNNQNHALEAYANSNGATLDARGSNANLMFDIGGSERLRITSAGNVGINSTIPRSKLHVASGTSGYNTGNPTGLGAGAIASIESNGTVGLQFLSGNSHNNYIYFGDTNSATTGSIQYSHGANALIFNVNGGSERLRIASDGKVGINQASPNAPLSFNTGVGQKVEFYNQGSNNEFGIGVQSSELRISSGTNSRISFFTNGYSGDERLRIQSNGRVGINRETSSFMLDIRGNSSTGANLIRIVDGAETGHGSHPAKITAGGAYYQEMQMHCRRFAVHTWNGSAIAERFRIHHDGQVTMPEQPAWNLRPNANSTQSTSAGTNTVGWSNNTSGSSSSMCFLRGGVTLSGSTGSTSHNGSSTGRINVPVAGTYKVWCTIRCENTPGAGNIYLKVNGTTVARQHVEVWGRYNYAHGFHSHIINLSANSYIEWVVTISSGTHNISGYNDTVNWTGGHLIG